MRSLGIDVSHWQEHLDSSAKPFDFAIVKLSEGQANYRSSADVGDVKASRTNQMASEIHNYRIRGGYHYMRLQYNWQKQAEAFLEASEDLDLHFVSPDLEKANNDLLNKEGNWNWGNLSSYLSIAYEWTRYMEGLGKIVIPYINKSMYKAAVVNLKHTWLEKRPIWLAWYPDAISKWEDSNIEWAKKVNLPVLADGRVPLIWQFSENAPGKTWGVTGSMGLDINVWNGNAYTWLKIKKLIGLPSRWLRLIPRRPR